MSTGIRKKRFLKIPFYKNFEEDLFSSARSSQLFDVAMLSRLMLFQIFSETKKINFLKIILNCVNGKKLNDS
jgi:hypothetical protein